MAGLLALASAGFGFASSGTGPARGPVTYPEGPPPGHTGGFGEPTCHACHAGSELNPPGGVVRLRGPVGSYRPGARYELEVVLEAGALVTGGFQLAARLAETGADAGRLEEAGPRTQVVKDADTGISYAQQTREGTEATSEGTVRWTLSWKAPPPGSGAVVVHVAANAANDDASEFGDRVYADSLMVLEGATRWW